MASAAQNSLNLKPNYSVLSNYNNHSLGVQSSAFPVSESIYGGPSRIKLNIGGGTRAPVQGYLASANPVQAQPRNLKAPSKPRQAPVNRKAINQSVDLPKTRTLAQAPSS
jgi:hypothetical protein